MLVDRFDMRVLVGAVFASCMLCLLRDKQTVIRILKRHKVDIVSVNQAINQIRVFFLRKIENL
jgi:hypothetical protein